MVWRADLRDGHLWAERLLQRRGLRDKVCLPIRLYDGWRVSGSLTVIPESPVI